MDNSNAPLGRNQQRILTANGQVIPMKTTDEIKAGIEAAKAELDAKLARGEIDSIEYNKRLFELRAPEEYAPKATHDSKKGRYVGVVAIIVFILSAIPTVIYLNWRFYFENTLTASNLPDYSGFFESNGNITPVQIDFEQEISEDGNYKGRPISIDYKAYYVLSGLVVSVRDYWGFDPYDTLVPRDVCVLWDTRFFASGLYGNAYTQGERFCTGPEINEPSFSNNHIISATADIRNQIFGLGKGDMVRLSGYLVRVRYGGMVLDSSMARDDHGNYSCEVFYVTQVEKISY